MIYRKILLALIALPVAYTFSIFIEKPVAASTPVAVVAPASLPIRPMPMPTPSAVPSMEPLPDVSTFPPFIKVAEASVPAVPVHLSISGAQVNANIIPVGITTEGNLDVPPNYTEVGWYQYGPRPGEKGSAVLDAHVDDGAKVPGPFKHLRNLKIGDDILVTMSDGRTVRYIVTISEVHDTDKFPGQKVFHENDKHYLKLITCHGKFVPALKTYDQRLIITAVLAS